MPLEFQPQNRGRESHRNAERVPQSTAMERPTRDRMMRRPASRSVVSTPGERAPEWPESSAVQRRD